MLIAGWGERNLPPAWCGCESKEDPNCPAFKETPSAAC